MVDLELLVHISAPTTKKDDDRYRAEALAYLNFKPAIIHKGPPKTRKKTPPIMRPAKQAAPPKANSERACINSPAVPPHTILKALTRFAPSNYETPMGAQPILRPEHVLSTPLQKLEAIQHDWKQRSSSKKTPRSSANPILSETQLIFDTQFAVGALESQVYSASTSNFSTTISSPLQERTTKRPRLTQAEPLVPNSSPTWPSGDVIHIHHNIAAGEHSASPPTLETPQRMDPLSSQLPDSYGLSKSDGSGSIHTPSWNLPSDPLTTPSQITPPKPRSTKHKKALLPSSQTQSQSPSKSGRKPLQQLDANTSPRKSNSFPSPSSGTAVRKGKTPVFASFGNAPISDTTVAAIPTPLFSAAENRDSIVHAPGEHLNPPNVNRTRCHQPAILEDIPHELLVELSTLPQYIYSPDPPVGNLPIENATFLTEDLRGFLTFGPLASRYTQLVRENRKIETTERGHWLLHTSSWPVLEQIKFWKDLTKYVGGGKAGMATWCSRDTASSDESSGGLGVIKVWCYGEIVKHVFLFLFTLSNGKLGKQSNQWIDIDGEVVVNVLSKEEHIGLGNHER
ncbi:hypothetical protein EJ08DRAFT_731964 [Tothia fuscella]|uniref:Uncharacterized protein n=1 Tax=Tothia fuscella TaxID=1048955 RepID=A0A9P4NV57_9PEZI|nr:hypothetical protein EJ08DRAFT_731964 [Tothia fuscella]